MEFDDKFSEKEITLIDLLITLSMQKEKIVSEEELDEVPCAH